MPKGMLALILLPFLASASLAAGKSSAEHQATASNAPTDISDVQRAKSSAVVVAGTHLSPASVQDVDANGDGKISFEELLRHDLKSDF